MSDNNATMDERTIIERIGGKRLIGICVEEMYKRILRDEDLLPYFVDIDVKRLKQHQTKFLSLVFSERAKADSRFLESVRVIHADMEIQEHHFDRICYHLVGALTDMQVQQDLVQAIAASMAPFRDCFGAKAAQVKDDRSILQRLGGRKALDLCVEEVYFKLLCDQRLAKFFEGYNLKRLKTHQKTFLLLIFSNDVKRSDEFYESFRRTHEPLGLTVHHFDIFASHLVDIFVELNVKDDLVQAVVQELGPFRECFVPRRKPRRNPLQPIVQQVRKTMSFSPRKRMSGLRRDGSPKKKQFSPLWEFLTGRTRIEI